jgi:hypothetical protein
MPGAMNTSLQDSTAQHSKNMDMLIRYLLCTARYTGMLHSRNGLCLAHRLQSRCASSLQDNTAQHSKDMDMLVCCCLCTARYTDLLHRKIG